MKVSALVFMTLKVEVCVGSWEAAQPFEQLHKQASREATEAMSRLLQEGREKSKFKIVDEPAVMHVITKEKTS